MTNENKGEAYLSKSDGSYLVPAFEGDNGTNRITGPENRRIRKCAVGTAVRSGDRYEWSQKRTGKGSLDGSFSARNPNEDYKYLIMVCGGTVIIY